MKPIIHFAFSGLIAVPLLAATVSAKPSSGDRHAEHGRSVVTTTDRAPVELSAEPGSEADRLARKLMAGEIERARAYGEDPLVLVAMGRVNDTDELLFVQLQSPGECGSAGCNTVIFKYAGGQWVKTMDTIGGPVWGPHVSYRYGRRYQTLG